MKKICYASKKGGVAKTTSAIITGILLSQKSRVLLIDLDSQNALTSFFFSDLEKIEGNSILEAIKGEKLFSQVIYEINENIHVIPSVLEFEEIDDWQRTGKELILRKELNRIEDKYDYIIMDTPPSLRTETVLGLVATDIVIIPARLEKMDTRAIDFTLDKINTQIREDFNPTLEKIFILATQYNYHNRTVNDLAFETLQEEYPDLVIDMKIQQSSRISQFNYLGYQEGTEYSNFDEYKKLIEVIQ